MKSTSKGFSLIELLVVIFIVAILLRIAVGVYYLFDLKSRRSDGINSLLAISMSEERYRATNTTYGTLAQTYVSTTSPEGYYTLAVSGTSGTGYTATATGVGSQANDKEGSTSCGTLTLTVSNGTVTETPAACWPS